MKSTVRNIEPIVKDTYPRLMQTTDGETIILVKREYGVENRLEVYYEGTVVISTNPDFGFAEHCSVWQWLVPFHGEVVLSSED